VLCFKLPKTVIFLKREKHEIFLLLNISRSVIVKAMRTLQFLCCHLIAW